MVQRDELKKFRAELMRKVLNWSTAAELLDLQLVAAAEIKSAEACVGDKDDLRWHVHLLRCCADALAWQTLHPHTIRQLAKNQAAHPSITEQGAAFDFTISKAADAANAGVPVLIADLTNCLRIGDLVLPVDPELPRLEECKLSERPDQFAFQGRRGRQLSRMNGTLEYLATGRAKLHGEQATRMAVEVNVRSEYNWAVVNDVCSAALLSNIGSAMLSDSELIYATTETEASVFPDEIRDHRFLPPHAVVACHLVPIEEAWCEVPPPLNWDLLPELRIALQEGDLILYHIFDPWSLIGYSNDVGTIVDIQSVSDREGGHGYRLKIGDSEIVAGPTFTSSLLYGYETAKSIADRMLAFGAEVLKEIPPELHAAVQRT
jgi:hypothetical protein